MIIENETSPEQPDAGEMQRRAKIIDEVMRDDPELTKEEAHALYDEATQESEGPAPEPEEPETCFVCGEAFVDRDPIYYSEDGLMHGLCCGPERGSYCNADEAPLQEGECIPRPLIWTADAKHALPLASDRVHDDLCVDRFAMEMKSKLHRARIDGRSGWDNPARCTMADLSRMLIEHVGKGDPIDVANFAMMIHQRGGRIGNVAGSNDGGQPGLPVYSFTDEDVI